MILIADSGSTKTEWNLIVNNDDVRKFQTIGFNPYFIDSKGIEEELEKNLLPFVNELQVKKVFFYGAGCSSLQKKDIVREPLEKFFRIAEVEVEHDLLAAARSLCGHEKGIACILGTGSNSCLYDGNEIIENVESVGYMFGDEGGGVFIGKQLITAYLRNELPVELRIKFEEKYPVRFNHILDAVYKQAFPNRFLASFSPFMHENKEHPYIYQIIFDAFDKFITYQVSKYTNYSKFELNCTGSIGFHYMEILEKVAEKWNIKIGTINKTPMSGLVNYHKR